ncbi:MAG: IS110 family transposase [Phycisphaerae bacterium]|jgi:transposase
MKEYIAFDSHKHYTLAEREDARTGRSQQIRIEHRPGAIREYLRSCRKGTSVAVEALGSWYWIVQEIEEAGMQPRLVHPRKAKLMMGMINKTDKLDVHGLNRLQRNGTLPTVWIAPGPLRDLRELTRTRMVLTQQRARLKNRLGATLDKYGLAVQDWSDPYGKGARGELETLLDRLPEQTRFTGQALLEQLDFVQEQVKRHEQRLADLLEETAAMRLQRSLPGFGPILSAVVVLEMGEARRFGDAEHFASYAGTTPRVHSSGDKTRYGKLRPDVNRYLKWAFVEAANVIARHHRSWPDRHVSRLYARLKARKGGAKAIGAVARHLAEATYHVQNRQQPYRDPNVKRVFKEGLSATMA